MLTLFAAMALGPFLPVAAATAQPQAQVGAASLPQPLLRFTRYVRFRSAGREFVRYHFEVTNRADFATDLFVPSPGLPPCGTNSSSSRSWVDIYRSDANRIYGFCAIGAPDMLGQLWFALPVGEPRPESIYIEVKDRLTNRLQRSAATPLPDLPVQSSERAIATIGRWNIVRTEIGGGVSCDMRAPNNGEARQVMMGGTVGSGERFAAFSAPAWNLPSTRTEIGFVQGVGASTPIEGQVAGSEIRVNVANLDTIVRSRAQGTMRFWLGHRTDRDPHDTSGLLSYVTVDGEFVRAYDELLRCLAAG